MHRKSQTNLQSDFRGVRRRGGKTSASLLGFGGNGENGENEALQVVVINKASGA